MQRIIEGEASKLPVSGQDARRRTTSAAVEESGQDIFSAGLASARQAIRRNVWTIVGTVVACTVLAALYLLITPPNYTATTQILIDNREARVVSGNAVLSSLSSDQYVIDTQVEILRSAKIANDAARAIGIISKKGTLSTEQLKKVQNSIQVERLGLTFVIQIAYTAESPERAALMSNAIAEAYLADQRELKSSVIRQGHDWLKARTEQLRAEVVEADRRIQDYKARHKIVSSGDLTFGEQELAEYAKELTRARSELAEAEARQAQRARNEYDISQAKVRAMEEGLEELKRRLASHDKIVVGLNELKRESEAAARIYANFLTRLKETQAQDSLQSADARIISAAAPPSEASHPKKKIVLGLALAFGISLGVLLALAKETVRDLVHSRDDLAAIAGRATVIELPFVAAIASRKPRASMVGVSIHDGGGDTAVETAVTTHRVYRYVVDHPEASYSQSMGLLKNTLAVSSPGSKKPHNLVAVVSAREGEGKTATAVHLARYTASTGVRTLLIDCDLRNPRIAEACADVDTRPILDAFENGIDTEALFQSPTYDGLTVITAPEAGTIANPIEFLSSKEMAAFLAHCQDAFDLVILDTAPLGPYLDTRVLVSCADGVIVVAEAAGVSRGELRQALGDAQIDGDMIAAAVLNKCRPV